MLNIANITFVWVTITPLGNPVVPEEYIINAESLSMSASTTSNLKPELFTDSHAPTKKSIDSTAPIFSLLSIIIIFFIKLSSFFSSINLEETCSEQKIICDLDTFKACISSNLVQLLSTGVTVAPMYKADKTGIKYSVIIPRVVKDCRIFLWWYHEWSFAL
jgi:hypothetical protein